MDGAQSRPREDAGDGRIRLVEASHEAGLLLGPSAAPGAVLLEGPAHLRAGHEIRGAGPVGGVAVSLDGLERGEGLVEAAAIQVRGGDLVVALGLPAGLHRRGGFNGAPDVIEVPGAQRGQGLAGAREDCVLGVDPLEQQRRVLSPQPGQGPHGLRGALERVAVDVTFLLRDVGAGGCESRGVQAEGVQGQRPGLVPDTLLLRGVTALQLAFHALPGVHHRALFLGCGGHPHHPTPRIGEVHGVVCAREHLQVPRGEALEGGVGMRVHAGLITPGTTCLGRSGGPRQEELQAEREEGLHGVRSFRAWASDSDVQGRGLKR